MKGIKPESLYYQTKIHVTQQPRSMMNTTMGDVITIFQYRKQSKAPLMKYCKYWLTDLRNVRKLLFTLLAI
jgi:hypothetical protein